MAKIWKFPFDILDSGIIVPEGTEILTIRYQETRWGHGFMIWGRVPDPNTDKREVKNVYVIPTGDYVDPDLKYLNTIEVPKSGEIIHIFVE